MYPWLQQPLDELTSRHEAQRLAHALLVTGQAGVGKLALAQSLATRLLCHTGLGCGECKGCLLLKAGSHPDLRLVQIEEDATQIKIEQIRDLIDWVNQTAQMGGSKVSILTPAHKMNRSSANALLKIMEEPPARNYILLLTDEPAVLLPTIRSRAQQIDVPTPDAEVAIRWLTDNGQQDVDWRLLLEISRGSPLLALQRSDPNYLGRRRKLAEVWRDLWLGAGDVVGLVSSLDKEDLIEALELGIDLLADVARKQASGADNFMQNKDLATTIDALSAKLSKPRVLFSLGKLQQAQRLAKGSQNPNKALLLESLMIDCLYGEPSPDSGHSL